MLRDSIRYHESVLLRAILVLCIAALLHSQTPLENSGKPMRVPFECTEADTLAAGLTCSEEEPCPVYLELGAVEAVGNRIFLTGNLHTATTTIYSVLLSTDDAGKTWAEPHPRIRLGGLDQIQFVDFQNGWISGGILQTPPRDPFLLLTTDGCKTWHQRAIYDDSRVAVIERFWFDSKESGTLLIDARQEANRHELYETMTGGESWSLKQASAAPIRFPKTTPSGSSAWRVRADGATHSYDLEKSEADRWRKVASFLVHIGTCKQ